MNAVHIPVTIVPESAAQASVSARTHRSQIRIGALRALLREIQDKQDCRINRVQTAYLLDRLGVEMRHLDRLREEAERLQRAGIPQ